jgi:Na+-transporting methylmalonyl-CoA/oxaloacetate decarboxylase gamma subunit
MATTQVNGTDGEAPAGPPRRRVPMALVTWVFVILILLIVVVLLVVKITRGSTTVVPPPVAPASTAVVHAATSVPSAAFDAVGAQQAPDPGEAVLSGQPALTIGGRPAVVYMGGEFCPYCAAERWALVAALGRFGTFSHLGATMSSTAEVFAGTPTFTFDGTTYRSRYITFAGVEEYGDRLSTTAPAGFPKLRDPTPVEWALLRRYDTEPYVPGTGTFPFVDVDNRLVVSGSGIGFSPGVLQGRTMAQIATDLSDPTRSDTQAILGAANTLSAEICAATGGKPVPVCTSPGVRAGASRLGLP